MKIRLFFFLFPIIVNTGFAATTTGSVAITVTVPSSCTMSFNVPNMLIPLVSGYAGNGSTTLTIGCTNGADASLEITSQNNWQLIGTHYNEILTYTLVYPGGGQTSGATVQSTWSGGVANRIVLTGTATIADWVIPLNVNTATITSSSTADTYTDQVTLTLSY